VGTEGPGLDQLTLVTKRAQDPNRILPNARCWKLHHFMLSDFHSDLNRSCGFGRWSTPWMSHSWLSEKVAFCFGSGGLPAIAIVLPKGQSSTMPPFPLLSWEHRGCSKPRITLSGCVRIEPSVHRSAPLRESRSRRPRPSTVYLHSSLVPAPATANSPSVQYRANFRSHCIYDNFGDYPSSFTSTNTKTKT